MKNIEVLNISRMIQSKEYVEVSESIKSTKFQYALRRSTQTIMNEAREIQAAIEDMKSDELKDEIKKAAGKIDTKLQKKIEAFAKSKEFTDLLDIESNITLHKVKESDLPADLDGKQMGAAIWLIEMEK